MGFEQYKNNDQILTSEKSISGERISKTKSSFFDFDSEERVFFTPEILQKNENQRVEFHIYSDQTWLSGKHRINLKTEIPEYRDKNTNQLINLNQPIGIDIFEQFNDLNINAGTYKVAINFFKNLIGNFERQHLRIDEISPDRTELRLRAINSDDPEFLQQITEYIQTVNQTGRGYYKSYLLNFSRNKCILFVNSVVIGEYLYVKLNEPLPTQYDVDFKCWIVEELKPTYIDNVTILPSVGTRSFNKLSNPNWEAKSTTDLSSETNLKTWTELLGSSVQTSQQIIDTFFSGSLSGVKLNIDYRDFNNFVFYSSATERLENFRYKLQVVEQLVSQSSAVAEISGSVSTTNIADFTLQKNNLISGFDDFEKFLYYESSSKLTTFDISLQNANVPNITGSYIDNAPKRNSTYPYDLYSISSSQFIDWYDDLYQTASLYDQDNINALQYAIPEFIRLDESNISMITFVNMLGHHFDILYTYISHMTKINNREENPKLGMPNELLYSVAKQFGWSLSNGQQNQDLWQYTLGTNEAGIPITGSNTIGDPAVSGRDMTYTVWRRIINNLPLLLKSKGTKRSVQALLSCYGIPQSMITIKEYGGPRIERAPIYEQLNFDYALDLISNPAGTVQVNYSESINSVELRFRTDNVLTNPTMSSTMNLFSIGDNIVSVDFTSGTKGTIQINTTSSNEIELFDGGYLTTVLRTNGSNLDLIAKRSKFGKIVAAASASVTGTIDTSGSLILGGSAGSNRLQGQLQELRFWSSSLQDSAFDNHVKAPAAYNGNQDAYDELVFRLPLTQKIDHSLTSSLSGVEPNPSGISASFQSWTNNEPYDSIEETYYYDAISLAAGTFDDNKIRIENNELVGNLDVKARAELSQFDKAPLDSKKLGVYFSPQTMINRDIIAQLGFTELDKFIGDPGDLEDYSYPDLVKESTSYWKKYSENNDINSYIKIFTLFDLSFFKQLEQLLPARADVLSGILIQPNILERNKTKILPKIKRFDESLNTIITDVPPSASGESLSYSGEMEARVLTISAQDDDQYQAFLTSSQDDKYRGTIYSREYLIRSGSVYITASTPSDKSEAIIPFISGSVFSNIKEIKTIINFTTSYSPASVQDFLPTGIDNHRYNGAKMQSADFNIDSTDTVDGKPVVEFRSANPNQLIYQTNGTEGSFIIP
jgi:hypothetical protein